MNIEEMHGPKHPRWAGSRFCKVCGIELFERRQRQLYSCRSKECIAESRSRAATARATKVGRVFCKQCDQEITHGHRWQVTFCSRSCMAAWQSENLSRENSPLWQGGSSYSEYPPEFNAVLRAEIRERDGNRCQECGMPQTGDWPDIKVWLDVHHIDGDKENCETGNLITLCRSCHRKVHWDMLAEAA